LSQGHGAKLGIEAWSTRRLTDNCAEHRRSNQGRSQEATETLARRWTEHCGKHRVNKQRRRADETETFPITSYKVDMKICQTHTLCSCCSERRDRSKAKLEKETHKKPKQVSFVTRNGAPLRILQSDCGRGTCGKCKNDVGRMGRDEALCANCNRWRTRIKVTQETDLGRVEAITKTRGQPRGNAPRRPHLTNRVPGAKLHGPDRPNTGQEVAQKRF
jgi:hypothetical protein